MTPAEKMAQRLEAETLMCSGAMVRRIPAQDDLDAAALIRRLAAALSEFNIVIGAGLTAKHLERLRSDHADALRDVKEQA